MLKRFFVRFPLGALGSPRCTLTIIVLLNLPNQSAGYFQGPSGPPNFPVSQSGCQQLARQPASYRAASQSASHLWQGSAGPGTQPPVRAYVCVCVCLHVRPGDGRHVYGMLKAPSVRSGGEICFSRPKSRPVKWPPVYLGSRPLAAFTLGAGWLVGLRPWGA